MKFICRSLRVLILASLVCGLPVFAQEPNTFKASMLHINEVSSAGNDDFIEIYNTSSYIIKFPVGWYLLDESRDEDASIPIEEGLRIYPGKYLVLYAGSRPAVPPDIPAVALDFDLHDNGELQLIYRSDDDKTIADVFGWAGAADSWGYYPDGSSELFASLKPTPGDMNVLREQTGSKPKIRINEVQTKGSSIFNHDFIELYNFGMIPVSGAGLSVTDDDRTPVIMLPEDLLVAPGEYVVIVPGESDRRKLLDYDIEHLILADYSDTTFGLGKRDEVNLLLFGTVIDSKAWDDGHLLSAGYSLGSAMFWNSHTIPTPGRANIDRRAEDLLILE